MRNNLDTVLRDIQFTYHEVAITHSDLEHS